MGLLIENELTRIEFSAEAQASLQQPFLFMTEYYSKACDTNYVAIRQMASRVTSVSVYTLSVSGARHFNFSDLPLRLVPAIRPLFEAAGYTGSIDPVRGERITNVYLLAFFDQVLKGISSPLLQGPSSEYPEVQFDK